MTLPSKKKDTVIEFNQKKILLHEVDTYKVVFIDGVFSSLFVIDNS
jgi:hypothetical protein